MPASASACRRCLSPEYILFGNPPHRKAVASVRAPCPTCSCATTLSRTYVLNEPFTHPSAKCAKCSTHWHATPSIHATHTNRESARAVARKERYIIVISS
eukprot:3992182-Prymnesium_polylepis.1